MGLRARLEASKNRDSWTRRGQRDIHKQRDNVRLRHCYKCDRSAAHLGDAIRSHTLAGFVRLRRLYGNTHQFGTIRVHLRCGDSMRALPDWHDIRESRFLASKAKQCAYQQQQGKPSFHGAKVAPLRGSNQCAYNQLALGRW